MELSAKQLIEEVLVSVNEKKVKLGEPLVSAMHAVLHGENMTLTAEEIVGQLELEAFYRKTCFPRELIAKIDAFLTKNPEVEVKFAI